MRDGVVRSSSGRMVKCWLGFRGGRFFRHVFTYTDIRRMSLFVVVSTARGNMQPCGAVIDPVSWVKMLD
jgi:hypothetical protein